MIFSEKSKSPSLPRQVDSNCRIAPPARLESSIRKASRRHSSASSCSCVLQFEIPLATVYHTVQFAAANRIPCIVNPAPAAPIDFSQLRAASYFIPNESEAEQITGLSVRSPEDAAKCAAFLLEKGLQRVVLTLGERGCLLATREGSHLIPPFAVNALDTTGAGDAFIGSFAVFLAEGLSETDALARANLYAALSTTQVGTQKSFLTRPQFDQAWHSRAHNA